MNTPAFQNGISPLTSDEVESLRLDVSQWASPAAWRYVCAIGLCAESVTVQFETIDGEERFTWIIFEVGGEEFDWNPDDHAGTPYGELGLAAAVAKKLGRASEVAA